MPLISLPETTLSIPARMERPNQAPVTMGWPVAGGLNDASLFAEFADEVAAILSLELRRVDRAARRPHYTVQIMEEPRTVIIRAQGAAVTFTDWPEEMWPIDVSQVVNVVAARAASVARTAAA